jgi:WD40 repeat protein/Flp pilus assembly protein TadD
MVVPLVCPRGHPWRPDEHDNAPPPSACPVCGLSLHPPHEDIAPTLDFQSEIHKPELPQANTPPPADAHKTTGDAPTQPRVGNGSSRGGPVLSQHIAGYEILGELGRGGMGVVYKARQRSLNRLVALKMVLAGAQADPQQLDRFRAEAEAVARLQHPNIVQIYEISAFDGCPFFSLEYVDGGTLAQKLNGAPQSPRLAAQFVRLLALAIHSAHQKGIIHRDLKPSNVLLATPAEHISGTDSLHAETQAALRLYGIPKITDFGLAKHLDVQSQTRTGAIIGTPSYMAPEQAEGRTHAIGPATDVYALGTLLYEMLTGRPPFEGESSLNTIQQLLTQDPISPSQIHRKVPRDLEIICLKCLEKDPGRRYSSAEDLAEDLHCFLRGEPIEARPMGWWGRSVKWVRRHPTRATFVAVLSLATLVLLVVGAVYHIRLEGAYAAEQKSARESRENLIRLHVTEGVTAMNDGDGFTALLWFTEALRLDLDTAERERAHRERIAAVLHGLPRLTSIWVHDGSVNDSRFSPDGSRVLTAGDDGKAHLWDSETGESAAPALTHAGPVLRAIFSRDGSRIATASRDSTARVWDATTGKPVTPPLTHDGPVRWVDFSPDGRQLLTVAGSAARLWDASTGERLPGELRHDDAVTQARFSPDGRQIATAGEDGLVYFWDAASRRRSRRVLTHDRAVCCLAFSPDGKHLATGSADRMARIWDLSSGDSVGPPLRHRAALTCVVFAPFGHRLLTAAEDGVALIWRVRDGERLVDPLQHHSAIRSAVFSPDGCRVATGSDDNTARVWSATTGTPLTPLLRGKGGINQAVFSADGRRLVTASDDGTARVWDIVGRQQAVVLDESTRFRRRADRLLRVAAADISAPAEEPPGLVSPDGRFRLKIGEDNTARVYDAQTGAPVSPPLAHRNAVTSAAFSPDGRRVVTTSADQTARVWDAANGAPISPPLRHASTVMYAAFSPDGDRVVTASDDNTARIWDAERGTLLVPPLKHEGTVLWAAFDSEGRRVATAGRDKTARVWNATTGQPLSPPLQHPWAVQRVRFTDEGHHLLTSGSSGMVWSWELPCADCASDELHQLAEVLASSRIDEHRGIMPLESAELKTMWRALHESHSELFHSTTEDVHAWHQEMAEECIRGQHWSAALWHLDRLVQSQPDNWLNHARRGLARAELSRWSEAGNDFGEVVRRAPGEVEAWCLYALLRLYTGDAAGYRQACTALMELQDKKGDTRMAFLTAWAGTLSGDAGVKPQRLVELAERAVAHEPRDPDYLCALGAALFRAGDLGPAARPLNEALTLRTSRDSGREWLWLALVRYRMGLPVEARQWLDKAAPLTDELARTEEAAPSWARQLQLALLRREAEQLLKNGKSGSE